MEKHLHASFIWSSKKITHFQEAKVLLRLLKLCSVHFNKFKRIWPCKHNQPNIDALTVGTQRNRNSVFKSAHMLTGLEMLLELSLCACMYFQSSTEQKTLQVVSLENQHATSKTFKVPESTVIAKLDGSLLKMDTTFIKTCSNFRTQHLYWSYGLFLYIIQADWFCTV